MMRRRVSFYVHHHGRGHRSRTAAVLRHLETPATVLTSAELGGVELGGAETLDLPLDTGAPETDADLPTPPHLHYAPVGVPGLRSRVALIAGHLADVAPSLLVVDVSAEVAQLGRLSGVPTVVVRQHGHRWDLAHLAAYAGTAGLLAPFGRAMEEPDAPGWVRRRTFYAGGLSRLSGPFPSRDEARRRLGWETDADIVLLLRGSGGQGPDLDEVTKAAARTAPYRWVGLGYRQDRAPDRIHDAGWVDDPTLHLCAADVVVGSAGENTVMEVAAVRRPFVCIPEPRPFDEQVRKAARLRALDAAEVLDQWPPASAWPAVLAAARARGTERLSGLTDPEGAAKAAGWLDELATRFAS